MGPCVNKIAISARNKNSKYQQEVDLIRLGDFLKDIAGTTKLSNFTNNKLSPPNIDMKMDIEGSEVDVIPDLLYTGGIQFINKIIIEWYMKWLVVYRV